MTAIAIIPARGGSKRIPRKNIRDFLGKPIIAYSILAALESNLFEEVMVSTDDNEIATIAKDWGAVVPFERSAKNAGDFASTVEVILEVINDYESQGRKFEFGCCIYPTAPFVRPSRLLEGYEMLLSKKCDVVFPVTPFSSSIWRGLKMAENKVTMIWPENIDKRSQDLPPVYHDAGQWYWFDTKKVVEHKKLWTNNSLGIEIDQTEVQDIDHESDWLLAELKFQMKRS